MARKKSVKAKATKVEEPKVSTAQVVEAIKSDVQTIKEALESQPKVSFLIPLMPGESEGAYDTVSINGYLMQIKKGVLVNLPQSVVEILANKYKVEMSAGSEMLTSRSEEVRKALE